jgi:hypothetical protein
VTPLGPGAPGDLRNAIFQAVQDPTDDDVIDLTGVSGTINLSAMLPPVFTTGDGSLTILGPGAGNLTISGQGAVRPFFILQGDVRISDLTISNGLARGGNGGSKAGGGAGMGGGMLIDGTTGPTAVTLTNVTFNGNRAIGGNGGSNGRGGGGGGAGGDGGNNLGGGGGFLGTGGSGVLGVGEAIIGVGGGGGFTGAAGGGGGNGANVGGGGGGGDYGQAGGTGSTGGGNGGDNGGGGGGGGIDVSGFPVHSIGTSSPVTSSGKAGNGGFGGGGGARGGRDFYAGNGGDYGGGGGGSYGSGGFGGGGGSHYGQGGFGGGGGGGASGPSGSTGGLGGFGAGLGGYAGPGGGGAGMGGALFQRGGTLSLVGTAFTNNTATGGVGGANIGTVGGHNLADAVGYGGAIFIHGVAFGGTATASAPNGMPTFSGNSADDYSALLPTLNEAQLNLVMQYKAGVLADDTDDIAGTLEGPTNSPPTVAAAVSAVSADEGSTATNAGTFGDPDGNGTVTLSADIGTVTQDNATGTWSWSFDPTDGPGQSQTVTITATDSAGGVATATFALVVDNVAPAVDPIAGPVPGPVVRGQAVKFTGRFTDAGTPDTHQVTWNFGDGTGDFGPVNAAHGATLAASHVFTAAGTYTVTLTVRDDDGGETVVTRPVPVAVAALQADPDTPGQTNLVVGGTTGNDDILVATTSGTAAYVLINRVAVGGSPFNLSVPSGGRVVVFAQAGNDRVQVTGPRATEVHGGAGNDSLAGSAGDDALFGDDGRDYVSGGAGDDVLVGGFGRDSMTAGAGRDILIGGALAPTIPYAGVRSARQSWVTNQNPTAAIISAVVTATTDPGDADNLDVLTGGSGADLFVAGGIGLLSDFITDFAGTDKKRNVTL